MAKGIGSATEQKGQRDAGKSASSEGAPQKTQPQPQPESKKATASKGSGDSFHLSGETERRSASKAQGKTDAESTKSNAAYATPVVSPGVPAEQARVKAPTQPGNAAYGAEEASLGQLPEGPLGELPGGQLDPQKPYVPFSSSDSFDLLDYHIDYYGAMQAWLRDAAFHKDNNGTRYGNGTLTNDGVSSQEREVERAKQSVISDKLELQRFLDNELNLAKSGKYQALDFIQQMAVPDEIKQVTSGADAAANLGPDINNAQFALHRLSESFNKGDKSAATEWENMFQTHFKPRLFKDIDSFLKYAQENTERARSGQDFDSTYGIERKPFLFPLPPPPLDAV